MNVQMTFDLAALNRIVSGIGNDIGDSVRPAAQAGIQVIYDQVKANVRRIGRKTGNLEKSIYQAFSDKRSIDKKRATYAVGWNKKTAPHGGLIEFGHIQRYVVYVGKDGKFYAAKQRGAKGKKPSRKASQAVKDAYYVPLPNGPRQVAARPFLRPALQRLPDAESAIRRKILERVNGNT